GGRPLLVASGVVLVVVGVRVLRPPGVDAEAAGTRRRHNRPLLVASAAAVGLLTGLLANGGGFLLVPLYLLVFGMRMRQAVGTHWALGHVDWPLAGEFAAGLLPGSVSGSLLAQRVEGPAIRRGFGWFLV